MLFYGRILDICEFWYLWGSWKESLMEMKGQLYICISTIKWQQQFWLKHHNLSKKKHLTYNKVHHTHTHIYMYISVQFNRSIVSDSLQPHGLQHARPPHPSSIPGVYPGSSPLSRWCHPTISSSVVPFSPRLRFFPASGSFQMSQFFTSGGQSIGVSASTSVLPKSIQDWFLLGWSGWIFMEHSLV